MRYLAMAAVLSMMCLAFGCGSGDATTVEPICTANESAPCECAGGAQGTKKCLADESGWGGCEGCVTPPLCTAGSTQQCICDSGESATQTCAADGQSWGACNCPVPIEDVVEDVPEPEDIQPEEIEEPDLPLICLLNNCADDKHCTGCTDGRHICLIAENRCVACIPGTGQGCKPNEICSSWGICVPKELTCPTDPVTGIPKVVCLKNSDCMACSPMNQVCDTNTHICQACTETNTSHCLQSDICLNGKCSPKCPQSCDVDNDCAFCGGTSEAPAHACNMHKCSECSPTWPCDTGLVCLSNGVCYPPCGIVGPVSGTCLTDKDCTFCGDPKTPGTYTCKKPINDPEGHGTCTPQVAGCSDLGQGVVVLPPPYSDYTQACSKDYDCEGVGITLNVGKLIRDALGMDEVMGIAITDVNVTYGMNQCAEIQINQNLKCGICVPCKQDSDCKPVPVDPLIMGLFKEDPLAMIAGALLINMLYGNNAEHNLNFYCQPVAMGYGACMPCANPMQKCAGTSGGSGKCEHNVCETGSAMDPSCSECAKQVCAKDAYCCETEWDQVCVKEVDQFCATSCGGTEPGCASDICTNPDLPAQDPSCGPCVAAVCNADPFCCNKQNGMWDKYCVSGAAAQDACKSLCGGGCAHDECVLGGPLVAACSPCATSICGYDSYCCENDWDQQCVGEAEEDAACDCQ